MTDNYNEELQKLADRYSGQMQHVTTVRELLDGFVGQASANKLSENQLASKAWFEANGDIERQHTTGVYVREAKQGQAPILGVYVDSAPRVVDFKANKEIYLGRLAYYGYNVSDIDFKLTKYFKKDQTNEDEKEDIPTIDELPELSFEEQQQVEEIIQEVPEASKEKMRETVSLFMRRRKV